MYDLICEWCEKPFQAKKQRQGCNRTCSARLALQDRGGHPWRKEELQLIEDRSGSYPFPAIAHALRQLEKKKGWYIRTAESIRTKMKRLGLSQKCIWDNLSRWELGRILGVTYDRVELWTQKYGLPYTKVSRNQGCIKLSDFRKWARDNPQYLAALDFECLLWALEDTELAEYCSNLPLPTQSKPQPVLKRTTGERFESINAAERANYVSNGCIQSAIRRQGTSANSSWELIK